MTQHNDPRPLPPEIYQRRRVGAVVVLVLVVALLWWVVSSLTGGDEGQDQVAQTSQSSQSSAASEATSEPSESEPASSSESAEPSSSASADPSASAEPTESSAAGVPDEVANKDTCELDDLQLTVRPGAPTFRDGQQPNFFLEVNNPTKGDCDIDLGDNELRFEVFTMDSGYTRVWGDTDCNAPTSTGRLRLDPGQSRTYEMTVWSRTSSSPDSCENREAVGNGAYMLYGHIGEKTSESETFNLA
ncbi:hypothetical protein [Corynebacterium sp. AOP40-4SA-5]|uniref:hypothetical protein n=1 Tax=Corynebacterium sp. AOP40-4SA-5 TaxID=3457678 RepID=UPI00403418D4